MNGVVESQHGEINRALAGDEQLRQDHQLLHEELLKQNWDLREAHEKSLNEMEELKKFHRLKTMVKRSIEKNLRMKNLKPETEIMRQTPWSRIRGQNSVNEESPPGPCVSFWWPFL